MEERSYEKDDQKEARRRHDGVRCSDITWCFACCVDLAGCVDPVPII